MRTRRIVTRVEVKTGSVEDKLKALERLAVKATIRKKKRASERENRLGKRKQSSG